MSHDVLCLNIILIFCGDLQRRYAARQKLGLTAAAHHCFTNRVFYKLRQCLCAVKQ